MGGVLGRREGRRKGGGGGVVLQTSCGAGRADETEDPEQLPVLDTSVLLEHLLTSAEKKTFPHLFSLRELC